MPKYLVVSSSGNPSSNSRKMGRIAFRYLQETKADCGWLDLAEMGLPLCDAHACYAHPSAKKLTTAIELADGVIAFPRSPHCLLGGEAVNGGADRNEPVFLIVGCTNLFEEHAA